MAPIFGTNVQAGAILHAQMEDRLLSRQPVFVTAKIASMCLLATIATPKVIMPTADHVLLICTSGLDIGKGHQQNMYILLYVVLI